MPQPKHTPLQAAAPELLAFVKRAFEETSCICMFSALCDLACHHCEAGELIAKAEGTDAAL